MKTCGDFGGRTGRGTPCGRRVVAGRCPYHDDEAAELTAKTKAVVLDQYGKVPVLELACQAAEVGRSTVWRWRQEDPEFDRKVKEIEAQAPQSRREMVEDTMFVRIVRGKASAAETIFWLVNDSRRRRDGRWKDVKHIEERRFVFDPTQCTDEELDRIVKGEDPEAVLGERVEVR